MSPHAVGSVHGAVDVGSDVKRHVDALRDDHLGLQVLRVIHLVAGIADPTWSVHIHQMSKVQDFHWLHVRRGKGRASSWRLAGILAVVGARERCFIMVRTDQNRNSF